MAFKDLPEVSAACSEDLEPSGSYLRQAASRDLRNPRMDVVRHGDGFRHQIGALSL